MNNYLVLILSFFVINLSQSQNNDVLVGLNSDYSDSNQCIYTYSLKDGNINYQHNLRKINPFNNPYSSELLKVGNKYFGLGDKYSENDFGVIYSYNELSNEFKVEKSFSGNNGKMPWGNLMQASNGKIYGTTSYGGQFNYGVIFEYDLLNDTLKAIHHFDGLNGRNDKNISSNISSLIEISENILLGVTSDGGIFNNGIIYKIDLVQNSFTNLFDFSNQIGFKPSNYILKKDGCIYGTTQSDGLYYPGTVFKYSFNDNLFTTIYDFGYNRTGYKFFITNDNTLLFNYTSQKGGLIIDINTNQNNIILQDINSNFLEYDSVSNKMFVFGSRYLNESKIFEYDLINSAIVDSVILDYSKVGNTCLFLKYESNSNQFYFVNYSAGILKVTLTDKQVDNIAPFNDNNYFLFQNLSSEKYIGISIIDGYNSLYIIDNSILKVKSIFNQYLDGFGFFYTPVLAGNGKLYGVTRFGGIYNKGVIYEFDPFSNEFAVKVNFKDEFGIEPITQLCLSKNGKLYGATSKGGIFDDGTFFSFEPNSEEFKVILNYNNVDGFYYPLFIFENEFQTFELFSFNNGSYNNFGRIVNYYYDEKRNEYSINKIYNNPDVSMDYIVKSKISNKYYFISAFYNLPYTGILIEFDAQNKIFSEIKKFKQEEVMSINTNSLVSDNEGNLYFSSYFSGLYNKGSIFKFNISNEELLKLYDFNQNENMNTSRFEHHDQFLFGATISNYYINDEKIFKFNLQTLEYNDIYSYQNEINSYFGFKYLSLDDLLTPSENFIYPNPVNSELFIELENDSEISVYDQLGNQLLNKKGYKGRNFISVGGFANGIYIIKTDNQKSKFVKY